MNAATRTVVQGSIFRGSLKNLVLTKESLIVIVWFICVLVSAFLVVYVKDLERRLLSQFEVAQQASDRLQVEWSQLLLEQSTLTMQSRIEQIAQDQLDMELPSSNRIMMVDDE